MSRVSTQIATTQDVHLTGNLDPMSKATGCFLTWAHSQEASRQASDEGAGVCHTAELWIWRLQSSDHPSLTKDSSKGHLTLFVIVWSPDKTPCVSLASASKIIMGKRSQPFQLGSFQDSTVGRGGEDHSRCYRKKRKPRRCSISLPSPLADSTLKKIICYSRWETHCPG